MEINILESLGKIAGLAGISIGLVALIFKSIIRRKIFPTLEPERAYMIISRIINMSFILALLGLLCWLYLTNKEEASTVKSLNVIGHVKGKNDNPVSGVKVYFKQDQNNFDRTDSDGKFVLETKGNGTQFYDLMIFHDNYYAHEKNTEIDFSESNKKLDLGEFELKARPKKVIPETTEEEEEPIKTTTISIEYRGDAMACYLNLSMKIAGKSINPNSNRVLMHDIPLGNNEYSVNGSIDCGINGICNASGTGKLFVEKNATFYVIWENNAYGQCNVSLSTM